MLDIKKKIKIKNNFDILCHYLFNFKGMILKKFSNESIPKFQENQEQIVNQQNALISLLLGRVLEQREIIKLLSKRKDENLCLCQK